MASLFVVRGRDQGKHFPLERRPMRLGRDSSCDIRLNDSEASRVHAELRTDAEGCVVLTDLASSNGTSINGMRISQHRLASGDRVEIGGTWLVYTGASRPAGSRPGHDVEIVGRPDARATGPMMGDASRIVSSVASAAPFGTRVDRFSQLAAESVERPQSDRNLELMYRTALAVGRTDSIPELLERVLRLVFDWVAADRGCVMLREGGSDRLRPAARCDRDIDGGPPKKKGRIAISHTILDYVIERKEGVRTSDARDDSRFDSANSIVQGGVREALCVPLQGRYAVVGALYVDTYTSPGTIVESGYQARFNDEHLRLMTAIGYQAALAIEDTYYYSAMLASERLATMGQTIATLSHHIKNILQGMRGGSYLIEAGLRREDTAAVRRGWGIVERNQERISSLVMDMLTFSKEREPEKVDADLNETVADVIELMGSRAAEMNIELRFDPATDLPTASFDPDAMHRAVLNIVTNAIDAAAEGRDDADGPEDSHDSDDSDESGKAGSESDAESPDIGSPDTAATVVADERLGEASIETDARIGRVIVTTAFEPDVGWVIAVADNGPGIGPEDREKIFSLFESKKGSRGTGLGLPVSDKILREHGGRIELVDSAARGDAAVGERLGGAERVGACFRLILPTADSPAPESVVPAPGADIPGTQAIEQG